MNQEQDLLKRKRNRLEKHDYVTKKVGFCLWQKSFHDHVIRNREDYDEHVKYIYENPNNWYYDELYTGK